MTRLSSCAPVSSRDICVAGPALIIEPHQTVVVEPHWQAEVTAKNHLLLTRASEARDARRARHQRRSGSARSVQQALHRDRRADGLCAAEHRALRSTSRSGSTFSCAIFDARRTASSPTRRTSRCISARWTAASRQFGARSAPIFEPGDVWMLNAPYNGGTASSRHHSGDPSVRDKRRRDSVLRRGARAPRRYRRHRARLDEPEGHAHRGGGSSISTRSSWSRMGASAKTRCSQLLTQGPYPARDPAQERRRPEGAGRRQRQGAWRSSARWWRNTGSPWCRPIWAMCRTTPRRAWRA